MRAGIGFQNQCEHWWRKHFPKSVSRPEIREMLAHAGFFLRVEKPPWFFNAL